MRKIIVCLLMFCSFAGKATTEYKFRIWLKDKAGSGYSLAQPQQLLSARAINRRSAQHIRIDSADIPVSAKYKAALSQTGVRIVTSSRWLNTVVVSTTDSTVMSQIRKLPFVKATEPVWVGQASNLSTKFRSENVYEATHNRAAGEFEEYGSALPQLSVSNAQKLHQAGFHGEGKVIALIDAGFLAADTIQAYKKTSILGTKNFVHPDKSVYQGDKHGEMVLSTIAAVDSFKYIGSAPKAAFWLLLSEDVDTEFPVEEDYWAAAAEFADSVGVDVINTSLGYTQFDLSSMDHTQAQLDGKSIFVSRAAQMAADKGIFVCVSAGNEGNNAWQKISAPADAADVLTVGAINILHQIASFSSLGYSADNRVKPDVVAVGQNTYLLDPAGKVSVSSGTSFSSPLMAGMVTCLWQALPQLTNKELLTVIRQQSNFYTTPDVRYGYGIPDLWAVYQAKNSLNTNTAPQPEIFFSNRRNNTITVRNMPNSDSTYTLNIYTESGKMIFSEKMTNEEHTFRVKSLKKGFYIAFIESNNHRYTRKLFKQE